MANDATFTFRCALTTDSNPTLPADLPAIFRRRAKNALEQNRSDADASGKAVAYLEAADRLEAALKAQAEAIKATAAPLKKVPPEPKRKR